MKSLACGMNHHSFRVTDDVDVRVGVVHLQVCTQVCARATPGWWTPGFYHRIGLHDRHLISQARAQWDTPYLLPVHLVSPRTFPHCTSTFRNVCQDYVEVRPRRRCHAGDYYRGGLSSKFL